eukprot:gene869-1087_t
MGIETLVPVYLRFPIQSIRPTKESDLNLMNIKKQYYLDGTKKKELAEWYLEYIENQTERFLIQEASFNFSVIPVMYLDTPPSSMSEIDRDLKIVRRFVDDLSFNNNNSPKLNDINQQQQQQSTFSPTSSFSSLSLNDNNINSNNNEERKSSQQQQQQQIPLQHSTIIYQKLVEILILEVHKKINQFQMEALLIIYYDLSRLCEEYDLSILLPNPSIEIDHSNHHKNSLFYQNFRIKADEILQSLLMIKEQQQQQLQQRQQQHIIIPIPNLQPYLELLKDIKHLQTMKHYDKIFFNMNHSIVSPDDPVVGVTGLIVNRLHRLENELKTIYQHWSNKLPIAGNPTFNNYR